MSTQQTQGTRAWPAAGVPQTLASDSDRDRTADVLSAAFAEGRLTADEHSQRLSAAYASRSWQQLCQVTADLPGAGASAERIALPGTVTGADRCLLCVLLIVCPPVGIAWLFVSWRRSRADLGQRLARPSGPALVGER